MPDTTLRLTALNSVVVIERVELRVLLQVGVVAEVARRRGRAVDVDVVADVAAVHGVMGVAILRPNPVCLTRDA